jgi:hypothetical protein
MTNLQELNGNQLAQLLNKLDKEGREDEAISVESEMNFRYEFWYKIQLLENNQ